MSVKLDRKIKKICNYQLVSSIFYDYQERNKKINETDNRFSRPRRTLYYYFFFWKKGKKIENQEVDGKNG